MCELSNMIDVTTNQLCAVMKVTRRNISTSSVGSGRRDDHDRAERILASHIFDVAGW